MIAPGRYVAVGDMRCWKEFTLYADGHVKFVDAVDNHVSYWGVKHADGAAWLVDMGQRLARGELRKEG